MDRTARRGRRGSNASKKKDIVPIDDTNSELKIKARIKNPDGAVIATTSLLAAVQYRDFLFRRVADGTITSDEGTALNGILRNIMKLMEKCGIDDLSDPDDEDLEI